MTIDEQIAEAEREMAACRDRWLSTPAARTRRFTVYVLEASIEVDRLRALKSGEGREGER